MSRRKISTSPSLPTRAIGYVRISKDREDETSTETQQERIRAYCVAQGWDIVDVIVEPGRSAFKDSRSSRPGFAKAVQLVETGIADVFVCWKIDRVARNAIDLLTFVRDLEGRGARFASVTEHFDTSTGAGRMMLLMLAGLAEMESAQKSERLMAWHESRFAKGATPTGPRPFGYRRERNALLIDETEAAVIQEAAAKVLAGEPLRAIVRDLNGAGIVGKDGRPFNRRGLAAILTGPTVAALREVDNDVFIPSDVWEPILDRTTWDEVRAVLLDPARRTGAGNARRWLLTGIARCERDETPMVAKPHAAGTRYSCPTCHLSIEAARTDEVVERDLLALLDEATWRRLRTETPTPIDDLAFREAMNVLTAGFVAGDIDAAELAEMAESLQRQRQVVVRDLPDVADVRKAWPAFSVEGKRVILDAATESLTIRPTTRTNRYDASRVAFVPAF